MENKFQSNSGGRVALSDSERHIEATNLYKTKDNLKRVGLGTPLKKHSGLLDQRSTTPGGGVVLSGSERHIETTNLYKTKNNLKRVGLDMGCALLDLRGIS
jgi:hypothetical protein